MITKTYDETKYKLVPIEPTDEMYSAGVKERIRNRSNINPYQTYAAMIDAATDVPDAAPHSECDQCVRYDLDCDGRQHNSLTESTPELTDDEIQAIWNVESGSIPGWKRHISFARTVIAADRAKRGA